MLEGILSTKWQGELVLENSQIKEIVQMVDDRIHKKTNNNGVGYVVTLEQSSTLG